MAEVTQHKLRPNYIHMAKPSELYVDWKTNLSRGGQEPEIDEALISLAKDMMPKTGDGDEATGSSGQLNPILVRFLSDGRRQVIGGFRRMKAALLLIERGLCPDFKIKYVISTLNDAEAALTNVAENINREDPKPIQLAHAVRSLTEDYGMDLEAVAGRLKRSVSYLTGLLDLLNLPSKIKASVANGDVPVSAALELGKLPAEKQIEVFNELTGNGEKISVKAVKTKRREHQESTGEGKAIKRDLKELVGWLECQTGEADNGHKIAVALLDWLEGKLTTTKLEKTWNKEFSG